MNCKEGANLLNKHIDFILDHISFLCLAYHRLSPTRNTKDMLGQVLNPFGTAVQAKSAERIGYIRIK